MLSAVLRSSVAIQTSIQIMNAFVEIRKVFLVNREVVQRLETVEKELLVNDFYFDKILKTIESNRLIPNQGIFFDGQVFDAQLVVSKIITSATSSMVVIDNYMDDTVLSVLTKKALGVKVGHMTKQISKQFENDVSKANSQFGDFFLKQFTFSHDRFLIINGSQIYHLGASITDLGNKWFAFTKLNSESVKNS